MKFLEVLAAFLALILDGIQDRKRRKQVKHHEDIQDDPTGELRRRGWLQSDADRDGVPPPSADRDSDTPDR